MTDYCMDNVQLQVELALAFIEEDPTTIGWKSTIQHKNDNGWADKSVWDKFFDSFCTAWINDAPIPAAQTPSPLIPVPASAVQHAEEPLVIETAVQPMTPTILSSPRQYPSTPTVPLLPRADGGENEEVLPDSTSTPLPVTLPTPADKPLAPVIADSSLTVSVDTLNPVSTRSVSDSPPPRLPRSLRRPSSPRIAPSPPPADNTQILSVTAVLDPPSPPVLSTTTSDSPLPPPPRSPRRPVSPKITCQPTGLAPLAIFTVVEDDNGPRRGVKTLANSAFDLDLAKLTPDDSPPPHPPRSQYHSPPPRRLDIFPRHTLEMPRDPDELADRPIYNQSCGNGRTQTPTSTHQCNGPRAKAEGVAPQTRLALLTPADFNGIEERELVKAQFGDAQVSLGFPGTEDNSGKTGLKRKGERKRRLKRKGESRVVREAKTMWYYTRSQVYHTS
ncbi:hypothetical protein EDB86DRAFT_3093347 [Lactarius hatsudake]|nr:hypothetical protein EDB86DRAFT_3093347 [Lactarius hatsudake]